MKNSIFGPFSNLASTFKFYPSFVDYHRLVSVTYVPPLVASRPRGSELTDAHHAVMTKHTTSYMDALMQGFYTVNTKNLSLVIQSIQSTS